MSQVMPQGIVESTQILRWSKDQDLTAKIEITNTN